METVPHKYVYSNCMAAGTCSVCGKTGGAPLVKKTGGQYSEEISSAKGHYSSRSMFDDSAVRVNMYANEACMKLLGIVAEELDVQNQYGEEISSAKGHYSSMSMFDDSAVRVNMYANEACMKLLGIVAEEIDG